MRRPSQASCLPRWWACPWLGRPGRSIPWPSLGRPVRPCWALASSPEPSLASSRWPRRPEPPDLALPPRRGAGAATGAGAAVLRVTTTGLGASKKSASRRCRAVRFLEGATRWASRRASNRSIWKLPPCGLRAFRCSAGGSRCRARGELGVLGRLGLEPDDDRIDRVERRGLEAIDDPGLALEDQDLSQRSSCQGPARS